MYTCVLPGNGIIKYNSYCDFSALTYEKGYMAGIVSMSWNEKTRKIELLKVKSAKENRLLTSSVSLFAMLYVSSIREPRIEKVTKISSVF